MLQLAGLGRLQRSSHFHNNNPNNSSNNNSSMESSGILELWTDGSLLQSGQGGAAFTFEQSPGLWAGQWDVIRGAGEDAQPLELIAIREAVRFLVDSVRATQAKTGSSLGLPETRTVTIVTDCMDALCELALFRSPAHPAMSSKRVTQVINVGLVSEIERLINEARGLKLLVLTRWQKRDTSDGNRVADCKAYRAARVGMRQVGSGIRTERGVFADESFNKAASRD